MKLPFFYIFLLTYTTSSKAAEINPWPPLEEGDQVAIIAPSRGGTAAQLNTATRLITSMGFTPITTYCKFAPNQFNYSNTDEKRSTYFDMAMADTNIKALFAIRGGQGACDVVFLLEKNQKGKDWQTKPLVGFSDTTALHLLLNSRGIPTIHGPVLTYNLESKSSTNAQQPFSVIKNYLMFPSTEHSYNKFELLNNIEDLETSIITGTSAGGNLTGVASTIGTPSEVPSNTLLILEDIGETPERIKRCLRQIYRGLKSRNKLPKAIIFGSFIANSKNISTALKGFAQQTPFPVLKTSDIGHGKKNIFIPLGVKISLNLSELSLSFKSWNGQE